MKLLRCICLMLVCMLANIHTALSLQTIRDCEIESVLLGYLKEIFKVAELDENNITLILVLDPEINAAATFNSTLLVNTGLIVKSSDVGQVLGVLAHETGHIAGNHPARKFGAVRKAMNPAMAAMALGAVVGIATGHPEVAVGMAAGSMDVAQRSFLHYNRGQEAAADQAAAKYLERLQWSPQGMMTFMQELEKQTLLSSQRQDPYLRTHPLTSERIDFFRHAVNNSAHTNKKFSAALVNSYERIKVKIFAFTAPPVEVLQTYPTKDKSLIARYGRAVAYHKKGERGKALAEINTLLSQHPNDPYFHELKGQILFENGNIPAAVESYRHAVKLLPDSGLLRVILAQALIESHHDKEALTHLLKAKKSEEHNGLMWRFLATAYGRLGQEGMASLALAELELRRGQDKHRATVTVKRALKLLPADKKQARLRANDILAELESLES